MPETSRIKAISCLLRQPDKFNLSLADAIPLNENPRSGDILFVRSLSNEGCATEFENQHGLMVRIYKGDNFVAVLADRKSGYSTSAAIPKGRVAKGAVLGLMHTNAIVGDPIFIPAYVGSHAMPVEVLGFVRGRDTPVANLSDATASKVSDWTRTNPRPGRMLFIIGTSSECGKTTLTANFNLSVKRQYADITTAAIKACGTGHNRDKRTMLDANYDCAVDFVDFGLATTYEIEPRRFSGVLTAMLNYSQAQADLVVVEIGGDFLEANAPESLRLLTSLDASCVLQVNDAMGALEGLRRLQALGLRPIAIGCFRQNLPALAARLAAEGYDGLKVIDSRDETAMDDLASTFVRSAFGADYRTISAGSCARAA